MKGMRLLLKFMTRLPIGVEPKFDSDSIGKSMKFFPIVGMVIGLILFAFFWGFSGIIYTPMLMIVLLVIIEVILTGGLHLDGLADTFDGIFSYRSKQKMLDIMKDSSLGTNGGLVLILYFILKIVLIYELEMTIGLPSGIVFLLTPAIARLNSVINCASAPYARATGLGKTFVDNTNGFGVIIATVLILLYTVVMVCFVLLLFVMLIIIPIVIIFGFNFANTMTRTIGELTCYPIEAVFEISEILVILLIYIFAVLFV